MIFSKTYLIYHAFILFIHLLIPLFSSEVLIDQSKTLKSQIKMNNASNQLNENLEQAYKARLMC